MTILPDPLSPAAVESAAVLARAAEAAAQVLPAVSPLSPVEPTPGNLGSAMGFSGAAIASFEAGIPGVVAVLVGADLVSALESSPLGSLDLAAATQPALDAAAAQLGARVGPARTVPLDLVVNDMGGMFTVTPLVGAEGSAALLVSDESLEATAAAAVAASAEPPAEQAPTPAPAPAPAPAAPVPPVAQSAPTPTMSQPMTQSAPPAPATPPPAQGPQPHVQPVSLGAFQPIPNGAAMAGPARGLEMLHGVAMDVTVELGRTRMSVRELLALAPGAVLQLDRAAGSPADLLVNGRLIARGEVVVVDEDFGLRVTEIVDDAGAA
jgi:flagellar motor switch protein FliN/FliY